MNDLDTRIGWPAGAFPSTRQSVLASLGEGVASGRDRDLERLVLISWKPVYCFVRRMGARSDEDAEDLAQEFFVRPARVGPGETAFRSAGLDFRLMDVYGRGVREVPA